MSIAKVNNDNRANYKTVTGAYYPLSLDDSSVAR